MIKKFNERIVVEGIPLWVSYFMIFGVLVGLGLGIVALTGNGDVLWTIGWAGREIGIAAAALVAILLKSPSAYVAVYIAGIFREASDFAEVLTYPEPNVIQLVIIVGLVLIGLRCAVLSNAGRKVNAT